MMSAINIVTDIILLLYGNYVLHTVSKKVTAQCSPPMRLERLFWDWDWCLQ